MAHPVFMFLKHIKFQCDSLREVLGLTATSLDKLTFKCPTNHYVCSVAFQHFQL